MQEQSPRRHRQSWGCAVNIEKLSRPEQSGDWHDKPLRWCVRGPGVEVQKFSTKKDALKYRSVRRKSFDFTAAVATFVNL